LVVLFQTEPLGALKFLIGVCLAVSTTFTISCKGAPLTAFGRGKVVPYVYKL